MGLQRSESEALSTLAKDLHHSDVTALYAAVGENQISATSVVEKLMIALGGTEGAVEDIAETAIPTRRPQRARTAHGDPGIVVHGKSTVIEELAALGTVNLGLSGTVTTGIVSAVDRPVTATGEDPSGQTHHT